MDLLSRINGISDVVVKSKVQKAKTVIERTIALYPLSSVAFSFNGGKDSTVLLHLLRAVVQEQGLSAEGSDSAGLAGARSFYFNRDDDFQEIKDFVTTMDQNYQLQVEYLEHPDFKAGLNGYLESTGVRAILLGTRRGDPNAGEQEFFCPSSPGWPPFMRVNPILDWTYADVWAFLKAAGVEYCSLYDQGYTSLGSTHNTTPNSSLRKEDGSYAPAHLLADGRLERAGRSKAALASTPSTEKPPGLTWKAGIVVVGDELLSGKVEDVNSNFLCRELRAIGWQVSKVVVVADDVTAIAEELKRMSPAVDAVLTSGGVGPTLDDVTMKAVADALGTSLVRCPELEQRLRGYFGANLAEAHLKMAEAPEGETEVIDHEPQEGGAPSPFPLVRCRNIFPLPGVPHLLRQKWSAVRHILQQAAELEPFHNRVLRLQQDDEALIAPALQLLAAELPADITIGSYPVEEQTDGAKVLVTLEGRLEAGVAAAAERLQQLLPAGCVVGQDVDVVALPKASRSRRSLDSIRAITPTAGVSNRRD